MKKSLVVVALASALTLLWASGLFAQWQPDKRLTYDGSSSVTSWSNARSVAACGDTVHVVWYDHRDGNDEIYYKRSTDNGATWGFLDTCLTDDPSVSNYPSVAASGSGVIAVWIDRRDTTPSWPKVYYKCSANNGQTWGADARLSDDSSSAGHPSVTFSGSVVQAVWAESRDGGNPEIYTKRSNDGGGSWGTNTRLTVNSYTSDDPSAAVSGSYVHVVWCELRDGRYEIYYKRSTTSGTTWGNDTLLSIGDAYSSSSPSISVSGSVVHVAWFDAPRGGEWEEVYYTRSTDNGATWGPATRLTYNPDRSWYPSISSYGSAVQVVWYDGGGSYNIFSKRSTDNGTTWSPDTRLTTGSILSSHCQSLSITANTAHMVWFNIRDGNLEVYYKRRLGSGGYDGFLTAPSQGRHIVRDPSRGQLHLVMHSEDDSVYYCRSTDSGDSWSVPLLLGAGKYPTVGLAMLPEDVYPPYYAVCVAYKPAGSFTKLMYQWNDGYSDPGAGTWHPESIRTSVTEFGPPSLVTFGPQIYVAYPTMPTANPSYIYCDNFYFSTPHDSVREIISSGAQDSLDQPCLAVDGNGEVYASWKRHDQIRYARRNGGAWDDTTRLDPTADSSQQPFIECYGDSVFVVWSEGFYSPSDVIRASRGLTYPPPPWLLSNPSNSSGIASESPTQAWREFTTWSEGTSGAQPDAWYWSLGWDKSQVELNPSTWSYWPHSQMWYTWISTELMNAWTESPVANQPPFTVMTKKLSFWFFGGGDAGAYYTASAGGSEPSPYLKKRDGVIRFADKAVDFARDSLVYELPYLDPVYDYYLKVSSYRETGHDWAQTLTVDGEKLRDVQMASGKVDTVWVKIPPAAYRKDRKVAFSLKKVRGDYVTSLGLTLYQRDPKRGKGGGQSGEPVGLPIREVFAVYPNPMNAQAQIEFSLKSAGLVDLSIYDVLGRLIRQVVNGKQPAGVHKVTWDGKDANGHQASSGIYFVKLNALGVNKTSRFVVVR